MSGNFLNMNSKLKKKAGNFLKTTSKSFEKKSGNFLKSYSKFAEKSLETFWTRLQNFWQNFWNLFENDLKIFWKTDWKLFENVLKILKEKVWKFLKMTSKGTYSPFIVSSLVRSQFIFHWNVFGKVPIHHSLKTTSKYEKMSGNSLKTTSEGLYSPFIERSFVLSLLTFHWKFFGKVQIHFSKKVRWKGPYSSFIELSLVRSQFISHWKFFG